MNETILQNAVYINYTTVGICCTYILFSIFYLKKIEFETIKIFLLPSIIIPLLIVLGYCSSLMWLSFDKNFRIGFLNLEYIDRAALMILIFSILITIGITYGRKKVLQNILNKKNERILDNIFYGKSGKDLFLLIISLSVIIFPFTFAWRIDLIFTEGIRNLEINNEFLFRLIPLARVLMLILSVISGIYYAHKKEKLIFIVPVLDTLHNLMKLSRGFFVPLLLFFVASSLAGQKYPKWMYYLVPVVGIVAGTAAVNARVVSAFGLSGYFAGLTQLNISPVESIRHFFEVNSVIGILSKTISLRDPSNNFIDGFISWLQTILPIPTFFGVNSEPLSFARLVGVDHAGIPMPVLGEIFFRMGWIGLLLFFFLGYFLGKLEGELIKHTLLYGKPYWPNIVIWMSLLFGFILSFHSPSRSASRYFIYSIMMLWLIKTLVIANTNRKIN